MNIQMQDSFVVMSTKKALYRMQTIIQVLKDK